MGSYGGDGEQGYGWMPIDGSLKQIDVGTNTVWGVNGDGDVFMRTGITKSQPEGCNWLQFPGTFEHVSVSKNGHVWAINSEQHIFVRVGASTENPEGDTWKQVSGHLSFVSVGASEAWGVDSLDQIYYRNGTFDDLVIFGLKWIKVPGSITYISSGDGEVWGVSSNGSVFARRGITKALPIGDSWKLDGGICKYLDVWGDTVWCTSTVENIFAKKV